MSVNTALASELEKLKTRKAELVAMLESKLEYATRSGRQDLNIQERAMVGDVRQLDARIKHAENELKRAGDVPQFGQKSGRPPETRGSTVPPEHRASRYSPMRFREEDMRRMHEALKARQECAIRADLEHRDFFSPDSMLPATLYPWPIQVIEHEPRLLDKFPGYAVETPSIEFIQHTGTTGSAGVVGEGQPKPELVFDLAQLTLPMSKIASHLALSWEILSDWDNFVSYAHAEHYRLTIVAENDQLINGTGASGELTGLLHTTGVLTHDCTADTGTNVTAIDSIQLSLAQLRTGSALAIPNLFITSPNTFTALKEIKDLYGRYILTPDPANDAPDTLWGVDVVQTTQIADGTGILLDTTKFGQAVIREPLLMRMGFAGNDFTNNLVRFVVEERLNLAVTRPAAVLIVEHLPA